MGRVFEWMWLTGAARQAREEWAVSRLRPQRTRWQAYLTLARRILHGVEPIDVSAQAPTAQCLILTGLHEVTRHTGLPELFELLTDANWKEPLLRAGLSPAAQEELRAALDAASVSSTDLSVENVKRLLVVMEAIVDRLTEPRRRLNAIALGRLARIVGLAAILAVLGLGARWALKPRYGPDLAAEKHWTASSAYSGYSRSGVKPVNPDDNMFFCTEEDDEPWWQLDLRGTPRINRVQIDNRGECCAERASPLVVEVSLDAQHWQEVSRNNETFKSWDAVFAPTPARFLRLRSLKKTFLHLKDVRVFAPRP